MYGLIDFLLLLLHFFFSISLICALILFLFFPFFRFNLLLFFQFLKVKVQIIDLQCFFIMIKSLKYKFFSQALLKGNTINFDMFCCHFPPVKMHYNFPCDFFYLWTLWKCVVEFLNIRGALNFFLLLISNLISCQRTQICFEPFEFIETWFVAYYMVYTVECFMFA